MTYGNLKFRLTRAFPGVDADLIEGWISDRYSEILGVLPWSRQQVEAILQTTAPYETGTVAVTNGSTSITGTGTTWTTGMTGRAFRAGTDDSYYEFTYVSSTTGTLDRAYEGTTDSAASYSINQSVYTLPSDCRLLEDDALSSFELGPLTRMSLAELNASQPVRTETGDPLLWATYMTDGSTPPRMQVVLYPIPDAAKGLKLTYVAEATALTTTSQIISVWLNPAAMIEGVTAKIKRHLRDYTGANEHDKQAAAALQLMLGAEAQGMSRMKMTLSDFFTSHRASRSSRS